MIARAMWDMLRTFLDNFFGLIPAIELELPRFSIVISWPDWMPFSVFASTGVVVVAWLAVLGLYAVASWIWRHIPTIAGFGT